MTSKLHPAVVQATKELHPPGIRIELVEMRDIQAPPVGTKGIVRLVDDIGTVHVNWDNGSTLGLVPGEDKWKIVKDEVNDK